VLQLWVPDLHPPRPPDPVVRDVAVAADLVARVDDHDALAERLAERPGDLADRRRLADARPEGGTARHKGKRGRDIEGLNCRHIHTSLIMNVCLSNAVKQSFYELLPEIWICLH